MRCAAASLRNRGMVLFAILVLVAVNVDGAGSDASIPKPLDEALPIHRAVKANDLVQQIYE
jgi:hypothetical protein